jgi:integrase
MICSVYKQKRKVEGKVVAGHLYWGQYRIDKQKKVIRIPLDTPDKQVAKVRLQKIVLELQQESAGLIAPSALRLAAAQNLEKPFELFEADMDKRRNDPTYVYDTCRRIKTLLKECKWVLPKDVSASSFEAWRARQTTCAKTLNDYLASARTFFRWMTKRGMLMGDPLTAVQPVKANGERRRPRRAFTDDEMKRLLAVAGPRATMYLTLFYTGLRRGEMESLVWADIDLDAPTPTLTVRAFASKNRKQARIPLHPDLATALKAFRPADAEPDDSVFRRFYRTKRFKEDLAAAGIEYRDAQGRYVDFHSFRHTTCTNLARAGVGMRTAMQVMRHSDARLTAVVYTDTDQLPTAAAIFGLPSLGSCTQQCTQNLVPEVKKVSSVVNGCPSDNPSEVAVTEGVKRDLTLLGDTCQKNEMVGTTGIEPVTSCV